MKYNISESEWKVMDILWKKPNSTIMDISNELGNCGWGYSTIKTLVHRLYKKGAIGADDSTGKFKYFPVATKEDCVQSETKSFLDRIYGGSVKMLMANLASKSELSEKEVKQLMSIIDKIEGGDKK